VETNANPPIDSYVDIHAHVLPGIDDGPEDLEQALTMVRAAAESGTATIAATPHLRPDFPDVHVHELAGRCQEVREAIERERIPIRLVSGAEVSVVWAVDASDEELALASYGQRGTDLLIETPTMKLVGMDRFLCQLQAKGYRVTLAHPERSLDFQRDDASLRELVAHGVLLEVNAESVHGSEADGRTRRFARRLLTEGLAQVLASDGHRGDSWRPVTMLAEGIEGAGELVGAERARWMATVAPAAIVDGVELPAAPPVIEQPKRHRLFGR
jgi:protein-tyrosine phosphatase